ncbi:MAG: DUF3179 domain-containing (seleno)protein, partial [Pseudomonadota bacterium]
MSHSARSLPRLALWSTAFAALIATAPLTAAADSHAQSALPAYIIEQFGEPPALPTDVDDAALADNMRTVFIDSVEDSSWREPQSEALAALVEAGDPRVVWPMSDLMRFVGNSGLIAVLADASSKLLGIEYPDGNVWGRTTDHLMAWRIPEPPMYLESKRAIFTNLVPGWDKLFVEGDIDWRHVSWGGVLIDDRAYDTTSELCNCIPAADNPEVTDVAGATWLDEDAVVFGLSINGEQRAYPRRIMEVREMVNDTLGGRDLGIPYCTLCGAAQAYFTDRVPEGVARPVLRTSGLLIRSNKVMYDVETYSIFDTFKGTAVTGPLAERGVALQQASMVTTTWGEWRKAYPDTTVLAEHLALGLDFDFRNNRDANGPIFPIGDTDPRLPV